MQDVLDGVRNASVGSEKGEAKNGVAERPVKPSWRERACYDTLKRRQTTR